MISEDWPDCADAQAYQSLRMTHKSYSKFGHTVALIVSLDKINQSPNTHTHKHTHTKEKKEKRILGRICTRKSLKH